MSEDETPIKDDSQATLDGSGEAEKPARKRAAKKAARKTARKRTSKSESSSDANESPKPAKSEKSAKDDTFDPGNEVSFSFDPNDVSEPGETADEKASNEPAPAKEQNQKPQDNNNNQQGGRHQNRKQKYQKGNFKKKHGKHNHPNQQKKQAKKRPQQKKNRRKAVDSIVLPPLGNLLEDETIKSIKDLKFLAEEGSGGGDPIKLNEFYQLPLLEFVAAVEEIGVTFDTAPNKRMLLDLLIK